MSYPSSPHGPSPDDPWAAPDVTAAQGQGHDSRAPLGDPGPLAQSFPGDPSAAYQSAPFGAGPPGQPPASGWAPPPAPYTQPGYPGSSYAPSNSKATQSMVWGVVSVVLQLTRLRPLGFIPGIVAVLLAQWARREIAAAHGTQSGGRLAIAGLVLGIIGIVLSVVQIIWLVLFMIAVSSSS